MFTAFERPFLRIIGTLCVLDFILIMLKGIRIDVYGYSILSGCALALVVAGLFYRHKRREEILAQVLICSGFFILFTQVGAIFNYMFFPLQFPLIDAALIRFDALFGYYWPDWVAFAARHPSLGLALYYVYFTSLPQLILMLLYLGFSGQSFKLYHFLLTGVLGALMCVLIWIFFPSFGPSAVYTLPEDVLRAFPLSAHPGYGSELLKLAREGTVLITPQNILGLIGFPSFHTVMACMSVVFAYGNRKIAIPIFLINILMIPAILIQGGHHLSDVFAGIIIFMCAYKVAKKMLMIAAQRDRNGNVQTLIVSAKEME